MPQSWVEKRLEQDPDFAIASEAEALVLSTCDAIYEELDRRTLKKSELAGRLGTSKANVTQLLKGRNLTLRTLARIAYALGLRVVPIRFEPLDASPPMGIAPEDGALHYRFRMEINPSPAFRAVIWAPDVRSPFSAELTPAYAQ